MYKFLFSLGENVSFTRSLLIYLSVHFLPANFVSGEHGIENSLEVVVHCRFVVFAEILPAAAAFLLSRGGETSL